MTTNRKNQHPAAIDAEKPTDMKTKTRRAAALLLMLALLAPLAARAQSRDCNGSITITVDAPYTQDFESPQGTAWNEAGPLPDCWEGYSNGSVVPHNTTRFYHSGAQSLSLCKSTWFDDSYAILPEFSNPLHQLQISFYVRTAEGSYDIPLLGYITADDNGTCNTFTPIASYALSSWLQYTQELHTVPATAARLVFRWSGDKDDCCCIDDVVVSLSPLDCYQVGALNLGEVSANSAYLSWDLIDAEQTAWDVQVATDATFTENVTNLVATTHENYLLTGLNAASYYYVRVKPQCDDDFWSNTISFGTLCDGPVTITADAPYTEGFESPWGNNIFESGCLPVCWEGYSTTGVIPRNFKGGFHSGSQSLLIGNSSWGDYYAVLPEFSNAIGELQVGFWMVTQNPYGGTGQLQLGYLTAEDDGTCNTFAEIATYDNPDSGMEQRITYLILENVPATAQRLAFKWHGEGRWCFVDDVEVSICTLDCFPVGAISVNSSSANSAYLTWNLIDNSQTAWDVQVATNAAFTENLVEYVAASHENYLVEGLNSATYYYVRVKPTCSDDLWSNVISFWASVPCDGPITITADTSYIESFESPTGTNYWESGLLPSCWEAYSTGTVAPHNTLNYAHSGSQCLTFRPPGNHYAILPEFGNPLDELQINFWISIVDLDQSMQLGYLTAEDDGTCNTFTAIATYTNTTSSWTSHTAYLELLDVPATAQRLAFKWNGGYCYFDDVDVSLAPNCYPVDNLSLGEVTSNSAYLSWDLVDNSQTAWDVQVATDAAFTENVANLVADSHENYLLEGLSIGTYFYVRVKPACSEDLWNVLEFALPCAPITVTADAPYTQGFESPEGTLWTQHGLLPPCWEGYNNPSYPTPHNTIGSYGTPHIIHSGAQCLSFCNEDGDSYAILPEFSNPISDLQINFWMATNGNTTDKLRLGYLTTEDDGTCNTFTEIASYDSNSGSMVQRSKILENVPAEAYRLAFKWSTSYYYLCFIDDVEVSINPCANPINLAVGNLTQETADITWEGSLCNYAVRHRTAAHYDGTVIDEPFNIDELPAGWDRYQTTSYGSFSPTLFGWLFTTYGLGAYNMRCRLYDHNTNYWLVTPGFTVGENYTLSFDVALTDHDNDNPPVTPCNNQTTFIVQITTDNMSSWQTLREWNNSGSEYVLNDIPHTGQNVSGISLADYEGQNVRIAFHCVRTDYNYDWVNDLHIDNVLIGNPVAVAAGEWTDPVAVTGNMHRLTGLTAGTRYDAQVRSNLGECDNWNDVPTFKTLEENAGKFFLYEGNWNEADNWVPAGVPTASDKVTLRADATIPAGSVAFANAIAGTDEHTLTLKDGGQLFHYQNINYQNITMTLEKEIAGHDGSSAAGWYFIGSPVVGANSVTPSAENGFLVNDYDLYYYDETTHYWMNHKPGNSNSGFGLTYGSGFLYANDEGTTLKISGKVRYSENYATKTGLTHEAEVLNGFNLVGNPFLHNARVNTTAYVIDNGAVVAYTEGTKILAPGEGVMVQTTSSFVSFYRVDPDAAAPQPKQLQITVNQEAEQRGEASSTTLLDNAIINFKDGGTLEKFDFGRTDARVYIPQGGKDYAIVSVGRDGACTVSTNGTGCTDGACTVSTEMPLNFKAAKNGTYTLSFNLENLDLDYLHLIDNLTGADVDLLTPIPETLIARKQNPHSAKAELIAGEDPQSTHSYTFTAKTTDYASRFRLVFTANPNCGDAIGDNAPFAYISNGEIRLLVETSTETTLQIVDMLGRVVVSRDVSGDNSGDISGNISTVGMPTGVYVLRLIDGDTIRTQKIVLGF